MEFHHKVRTLPFKVQPEEKEETVTDVEKIFANPTAYEGLVFGIFEECFLH